jgi:hypothetical protein
MLKAPPWFGGQMGVPGSDTPEGFRWYPDALTFYVDGGHDEADDNNDGTDPRYPLATISQAITNTTSGRGDVIYVGPGTYNPTAAITVDKADISIIGQPIGGNPEQPENGAVIYPAASYDTGPMFILEEPCTLAYLDIVTRFTGPHGGAAATASASLVFDGDGGSTHGGFCHIHHCRFADWWGSVTGLYYRGGAYNLVEYCNFEGFDAGVQFYSGTNNPDYNVIRNCGFYECTNGIEVLGGAPHHTLIKGNIFIDYTDAIDFDQAGGGAGDGLVCGNYYETATDAATYDCTVAQAQAIGWNFSGNNYSE